ncbi:carboxylesterase/lipase family protein [Aquabacterium sp.]|uniref:carboxylesterase/lipase family protein n=1 Tax=Aquabacterium sp. TaxID=1872578 RepID=UPI002C9A3EB1|nr:carboxylesterase family protein [Aquabacterium sp.]HSW07403.1 carboxylesterase family protein [Aquabacterium sp.]
MKDFHSLTLGVLSVATLLAGCGGSDDPPPTERRTTLGTVVGLDHSASNGTYAWLGLPFAKPPVGALRWKAPAEPEAWTNARETQAFGKACLQNGRIYGPGANNTYDTTIVSTLNMPVGQEDCLTLNIWRPASADTQLPVLFFIYGGSNTSGYTADPVYNGANLAKAANAVVVTANYRLGVLGFFNLPQLKAGAGSAEASGNFALLDNLQALKFVSQNIASFGGNPGNVTVMGQSAGAINTWALMTSPLSTGLFHKTIPISGGLSLASNLPPGMLPTLNTASAYLAQANNLLYNLVIADGKALDMATAKTFVATQTDAQIADYLRDKDAGVLLGTVLNKGLTGSGPIPDGTVLPADPIAAIAAGNYRKVPVLASNTRDEGKLFAQFLTLFGGPPGFKISDATRFAMMMGFNPDAAPTLSEADIIDPAYLPSDAAGTGWSAKSALLASVFTSPSRDNMLNTLKTQQANVWHYQFDWAQEPAPWNTVYGAAHAFDLPFVFGNFGPSLFSNASNSAANQPGRLALSNAMMQTIGAFMRNGDPNNAALGVTWPAWPAQLHFDATLTQPKISVQ